LIGQLNLSKIHSWKRRPSEKSKAELPDPTPPPPLQSAGAAPSHGVAADDGDYLALPFIELVGDHN
jgi:hypothetical protein